MDKKLLLIGGIFILAFLSFMGVVFLDEPIGRLTRAANPDRQPSLQTSLLFAWPLEIPADGQTKSDITVFVRDADGQGMENQQVRITSTIGIIDQPNTTTDSNGEATFSLTSSSIGIANIEAFVDNTKLPRKVSVQIK